MSIDKDFVVKNGLEVNEDLLYADDSTGNVGIGTTLADKKFVVIGDAEVSSNLSVGTTITAQRGVFSGIVTVTDGLDLGIGGTFLSAVKADKKIGINSTNPTYTLDIIGPVSTGTTATYIFGDLEVTGNIKGTALQGQISAGGTVGFTNVTVDNILDANNAEIYTKFNIEEVNSNTFRYLTAGSPPGIGFTQNTDNPEIFLRRAQKYEFHVNSASFPFYIKTQPTADLNNQYNDGVEQNGSQVGIVTFKVPMNAPNILYYQASNQAGMGGTIYIDNDYQSYQVGVLTVTELLDGSNADADFENIYVSGIGTINNLKGPQNFSVSAGILTVRQDQTALIGVSTGAEKLRIDERNNNENYKVTFTRSTGVNSNYQVSFVDSDTGKFTYNPSTNTLVLDTVVASLTGIATGSQRVNIDRKSDNTNYQVAFTEPGTDEYQALYLDTQSSQFTYNPNSNTLTVANFVGNLTGTATTASNADLINVGLSNNDETYQILFSGGSGYQRSYIDSVNSNLTYNPNTNTFFATNITGKGDNITNLDAANISQGVVNVNRLPDASTSAQGVVKLNDTYPVTGTSTTTSITTNVAKQLYDDITNFDAANITQGVVDVDRLPDASTTDQGVVKLNNTYPVTGTSTTQTITTNVARQLYNETVGVIPSGTRMLFYQSAAPTGWTQVTNDVVNNSALRVVNTAGGGSGGSVNFTNAFKTRLVPLLSHNHSITDAGHVHGTTEPNNGQGHRHKYTYQSDAAGEKEFGQDKNDGKIETNQTNFAKANITIDNAVTGITIDSEGDTAASMNFNVKYLDVIICQKNTY